VSPEPVDPPEDPLEPVELPDDEPLSFEPEDVLEPLSLPPSSEEELPLEDDDPDDELLRSIPPEFVVTEPPKVDSVDEIVETVVTTFVPTVDVVFDETAPALPAQGLDPGGAAAFIEATQASYAPVCNSTWVNVLYCPA